MKNSIWQSPWLRSLGSALAGFIGYGAWAYYANMNHGMNEGIKAALVQGSFSFVITLIINSLMEVLYHRLQNVNAGRWLATIIACCTLYFASYTVNYLAGTMNILKTILPGAVMSTVYILAYIKTLHVLALKAQKQKT